MRNILIIGVGKFSRILGQKMMELGNQVMIIDRNEEVINNLAPSFTNAMVGEGTNEALLKSLDVKQFDVCFVTVGDDFQSSLEITCQLKELGAKRVIAKANRDLQVKFLLRNGADEVVYPDRDTANKVAVECNNDNIFDYSCLSNNYAIYEIAAPKRWLGKKIREANIRQKFGINILAVKHNGNITMVDGDYEFNTEDHLLVLGQEENVFKIIR